MPNYNNDILIKNIKQLMKDNGVSQLQLAKDLLSNQSNISKCLSGNKTISIEFAYQIAYRFGVSIDYLCNDHSEELKTTANEEPFAAIEEEPAKTYDSPAQILIKVCTALATIFKTSTPRTYSFELREEVYIEDTDEYGNEIGYFYQKKDSLGLDPTNKYTSLYFPNYSKIQRSFDNRGDADEYFAILQECGNSNDINRNINKFLKQLTDLHTVYLEGSMTPESYHNAIDSNLAALIAIWDKP